MTTKGKEAIALLEKELGPLTFAMFLRASRSSMGITQVELAKTLSVAKGTLCDLEKGRQMASPTLAKRIALKAGFSVKTAIQACLQDQLNKAKIKLNVRLVA
jgi:DNA-binding XRE family transcriptional regulator